MPNTLSSFRIEALHDRYTFDIPITDNKLVLIGENGAGKSTVANFIYFFLTNQWSRMLAYKFKSVSAVIDDQPVMFPREMLEETLRKEKIKTVTTYLGSNVIDHTTFDDLSQDRAEYEMLSSITEEVIELLRKRSSNIQASVRTLESSFKEKVLFLPTYRRIEQDLASIFPEEDRSLRFKRWLDGLRHVAQNSRYVELFQFGMQDVEETIKRNMSQLEASWREDQQELIATNLRDVVQEGHRPGELIDVAKLDILAISAILQRMDKSILPVSTQQKLLNVVSKVRNETSLKNDNSIVLLLLTHLVELYKKRKQREKDVQDFVAVCNKYLSNKKMKYDDTNFSIFVHLLDDESEEDKLEMSKLSSGEKQIVSLFSHLYLSGGSDYFVIIDEPELSLSIEWQKNFLPDILKSGRCSGLIAVTHSPFICDNELSKYMRSVERFVKPAYDR